MLEALVNVPLDLDRGEDVSENFAVVDPSGRLILPQNLVKKFGLTPGDQVYMEAGEDTLRLHRPVTRPARIYVEPTTRCNMNCAMCQRHTWDHEPADMLPEVFQRVLETLETCDPVPSVVFGGFGEPLLHPDILSFIRACKKRHSPVELITNGLLLNRERLDDLKRLRLDRLWLSVDGLGDDCDGHVRDQGAFNRMKGHLKSMFGMTYYSGEMTPGLGFVFVAMKDNIHEFPEVMKLARSLNVDKIIVSNLLPYTRQGLDQILYTRSTWEMAGRSFQVKLPRMDLWGDSVGIILKGLAHQDMGEFMGREYQEPMNTCPFLKKASLSVGQDGRVSPCPPLLHSHACFFQGVERKNREHSFGNLKDRKLLDIWNDEPYAAFRKRVKAFDFSPCVSCASCEWAEANEEDCTGNTFPTCGGCLWAQGLVQCP
ncbi:MAG: radical SAM protein [Desulfobacteraceae bacterium]|nr:radical SAM protein [Desulfobacteraceae bacterium]